jgi:hypothetical protein
MRQTFIILLSLLSISGISFAQQRVKESMTEKTFGIPMVTMVREYQIDLGNGNEFRVSVSEVSELGLLANIDSILQVFMLDMVPLKDSFADPARSKRFDYVIDTGGIKKIQITQFRPMSDHFLINRAGISALKMEQDTIIISGFLRNNSIFKNKQAVSYFQIKLFLNLVSELPNIVDGRLNEKMKTIIGTLNSSFQPVFRPMLNGLYQIKADTSIFLRRSGGAHFRNNSGVNLYIATNIQNYKNYFVPSVSLGMAFRLNNGLTTHDLGLYWEPQFLFAMNPSQNKLNTYQNDYITLFYKLGYTSNNYRHQYQLFNFHPFISIGWLYRQEGSFFDEHSFQLGVGILTFLGGSVSIEPQLYFHNFFENVTPGLRLVVRYGR